MTSHEAHEAAATITLKPCALRKLRVEFGGQALSDDMLIKVSFVGEDSDRPGFDTVIYRCETVRADELAHYPPAWLIHRIRDAIKRTMLHELDECFAVNGKRTHEPHPEVR